MVWVEPLTCGVTSLRIATDDAPHLDLEGVRALVAVVRRMRASKTLHAVVVEGGDNYFCSGASRSSLEALAQPNRRTLLAQACNRIPSALLSIPVPTIAAMKGHAIGGGFVLGLWCDMPILAEESLYGANFTNLGFTPGMGATFVLEESLGALAAREMLITGRLVKGRELRLTGSSLGRLVTGRAAVRERALELAVEIAQMPRGAMVLLKSALAKRRLAALRRALRQEAAMHRRIFAKTDWAQFLEERYAWLADGHCEASVERVC